MNMDHVYTWLCMHILLTCGFPVVSPRKGYFAMRAFAATAQSPNLG